MKYLNTESNLVILGAWNIAILQPNWFLKHFKEFKKEEKIPVEFLASTNPRMRFKLNDILICPENGRLTLFPQNNSIENLNFITKISSGVCEKLYHTPITATGNNFIFELEENESHVMDNFLDTEKQNDYYENIGLQNFNNRSFTHSFSFSNYILNIAYNNKLKDKTILTYNFHYETKTKEAILNAINSLVKNFERASELNSKLIERKK